MIDYTLVRSNRKSVSLRIKNDGSVEVRCPLHVQQSEVDNFVLQQQNWIEKHAADIKLKNKKRNSFTVEIGSSLRLLGKIYPLEGISTDKAGFNGEYFYVPNNLPEDEIKPLVIEIYKNIATSSLKYKVKKFSSLMGVEPIAVKINSAHTRWGSCSAKNSINFSWLLIMAHEACVDYVVVHELAHILHHNHSKDFWSVVGKMLPDYKQREKHLKELQEIISLENWR